MSVELRIGEEDGGKLKRSLYVDLVNLPDPVKLSLDVRIFNYDSVPLYMRVDAYDAAWTFTSNDFGSVASGDNIYRLIDQFGSRTKPAAETTETIIVRLRAYTDAGYTNLKWTFERVVDIVFIKSDDGSWTQDFLNNFDDGTVQGWAVAADYGQEAGYPKIAVFTDFVLSPAYSLGWDTASIFNVTGASHCYKSFNTPNRNKVFAIFDIRYRNLTYWGLKNLRFRTNGGTPVTLVFLGRPADTVDAPYVTGNRWLRIVVPLPKNTTVEVQMFAEHYHPTDATRSRIYMDDFRIISKD